MKKLIIATVFIACLALCAAVGTVKSYAQNSLQTPAE